MKVPLSENAKRVLENPEALNKIMTAMSSRHIGPVKTPFIVTVILDKKNKITLTI
ncbi:hypothetical protein [Pseudomonas sp. NPDC089569]|uniref:hypothetical protein n=1 Tax=Pseudomonas sp. NPDC089569 TaxID=3390722 RepID=UPI003CFDD45D